MYAQAGEAFAGGDHPPHDLTDPAQLREHLAVAWGVMRDNRPVMTALFESAMAAGPASGALWEQLAAAPACSASTWSTCGTSGHDCRAIPS